MIACVVALHFVRVVQYHAVLETRFVATILGRVLPAVAVAVAARPAGLVSSCFDPHRLHDLLLPLGCCWCHCRRDFVPVVAAAERDGLDDVASTRTVGPRQQRQGLS